MRPNPVDRPFRVFAWPRFDDAEELTQLVASYLLCSWPWPKAQLIVRIDPELDGDPEVAGKALREAIVGLVGDSPLNIATLSIKVEETAARGIGAVVEKIIQLPSNRLASRFTWMLWVSEGHKTRSHGQSITDAQLMPPDYKNIVAQLKELDPWLFPINIENVPVIPGRGLGLPAGSCESSVLWRDSVLVKAVVDRGALTNKSVLELGCGCGYWASRYVVRGASRVVGVEKDPRQLKQADLFWGRNRILLSQQYQFLNLDADEESSWEQIRARGPYDIVLHSALHTSADPMGLLEKMIRVTGERLVIDTRLEGAVTRQGILDVLKRNQLNAEVINNEIPTTPGTDGADSYEAGRRIAVIARRK